MDWHELEKMKVTDLREMAKEQTTLEGVSGMTKERLVEAMAHALGIPKPHKVVLSGEKTAVKQKIKALKAKIAEAMEKGDHTELKQWRRDVHHLKRRLRRQAKLAG